MGGRIASGERDEHKQLGREVHDVPSTVTEAEEELDRGQERTRRETRHRVRSVAIELRSRQQLRLRNEGVLQREERVQQGQLQEEERVLHKQRMARLAYVLVGVPDWLRLQSRDHAPCPGV
ncbi:hypothetical protein LIA77_02274 [Sarocladium implicatum]|nr:hypothetical protein LIA77_02274 [Sarocladium implicatum]